MRRFLVDDRGVTAVEYGLITVAVVLIALIMIEATGDAIATMANDVRSHLVGGTPGS
ncbi:MAG: Flp family type IVb pilin [Alphaproteobacteria bacterium]|nr:Flp family type IVb pilin [Alphaproteobacteria bacterium]